MPPRPEKRARTDEGDDYDEEEDDLEEDEMDDDMEDEENGDDDEHDAEADVDAETAAVLSLAEAGNANTYHNANTGDSGPDMPFPDEKIIDYCYRKGYFPASVPFPKATITNRFTEAPLIPLRPIERNPNNRRLWNGKKPVNWCALLLQVGGAELTEPCTRCAERNGLWKKCVVPNDWSTSWNVRGACANCYMDGLRGKCSRGFGYAIPNSSQSARSKVYKERAAKKAAAAGASASASAPEGAPAGPVLPPLPRGRPPRSAAAARSTAAAAPTTGPAPVPDMTTATAQGASNFTTAAFTPAQGANAGANGTYSNAPPPPNGRPYNPNNRDFESYKREYNTFGKVDLDRLAEQLATERARISLQLAALDSVRAAREAFQNYYPDGSDTPA